MKPATRYAVSEIPPYGRMIEEWESQIEGDGSAPKAWHSDIKWIEWRDSVIKLLGIVLWPTYDQATHKWVGPAQKFMWDLTRVDFELLRDLRPTLKGPLELANEKTTHYEMFRLEDEEDAEDKVTGQRVDRSVDVTLRRYLTSLADKRRVDDLVGGYVLGLHSKSGNVDLEMKRFFQRPRAYQMAVLMGETWFTHQHAKSAVTPAMISGHCFEMAMGGIAAFYRAREIGCSSAAIDALARHTIDVGDRRVLAGVHYPSDNISSWITALLIAPLVCSNQDGATWLWKAVQKHSSVYAAIKLKVEADPTGVYKKSFDLMQGIGRDSAFTIADALKRAQSATA